MDSLSVAEPIVFVVHSDPTVRRSVAALSAKWKIETFVTVSGFRRRRGVDGAACAILDITLPDGCGLTLQTHLAAHHPEISVVFISRHADVRSGVGAMKRGAVDFLTMPVVHAELSAAVDRAIARSSIVVAQVAELNALRLSYVTLTEREREVMSLVAIGLMNKQIAWRLGISEITVKAHRGKVMQKMAARSLADLVTKAAKLALTPSNITGNFLEEAVYHRPFHYSLPSLSHGIPAHNAA
jgi:FixJ family two-component response regulator